MTKQIDNALDDVEFDEVDQAETVLPLRTIMTDLACTICAVIDYARGDEHVSEIDVVHHFKGLGDDILKFMALEKA